MPPAIRWSPFLVLVLLFLPTTLGFTPGLLSYDQPHAFAGHWLVKLSLLPVITLFLWHATHRFRLMPHDFGLRQDPVVATSWFILLPPQVRLSWRCICGASETQHHRFPIGISVGLSHENFQGLFVISKQTAALVKTESFHTFGTVHAFAPVPIPEYLQKTYWWAYLHPKAVYIFERQWLVNMILWGNFARLRDAALQEVGEVIEGKVLQVACVYGDFTEHLARRLGAKGSLDVIDVAPIQIKNLRAKLKNPQHVTTLLQDSTDLQFDNGSHDTVVVFFLLHEQPADVRRNTIAEAMRVTRPGGKIIFVDYHRPVATSLFRYIMVPILATLEPFALGMWRGEIIDWLPAGMQPAKVEKQTYFGGLYQKVVITP